MAGLAAAVVLAGTAVAVSVGRNDGGGSCLSSLADHLPADAPVIAGSDRDRARDAGLPVDGSIEDLGDAALDPGFIFDPLTRDRVLTFESDADGVGYEAGDVRCWAGSAVEPLFAARGRFDADRVADGTVGVGAAVDGDLLAVVTDGDPGALLGGVAEVPAGMAELVRALDRRGAMTFTGTSGPGPGAELGDDLAEDEALWVGLGLADGGGDDWDLVLVWSFPGADEAADARRAVVEAAGSGDLPDLIDGDVDQLVEQDGSSLWLRARYTDDPATWPTLLRNFDPAVMPFVGGDDGAGGDDSGGG